MIISIDGPVASGKSTTAQHLARELGWYYINSGFLYRTLAYLVLNDLGLTLEEIVNVADDQIYDLLRRNTIRYQYADDGAHVLVNNQDVTPLLKQGSAIDEATSILSLNQAVRSIVDEMQEQLAKDHDVVVDGRDIGTVVFPHAEYKFFLTASVPERARRWRAAQERKGNTYTQRDAEEEVMNRDARDSARELSPLRKPDDAIEIDNTDLSEEETLQEILKRITS